MFLSIARSPSRNPSTYVCRQCLQSLAAARTAQQPGLRTISIPALTDGEESPQDDWISNFNDIAHSRQQEVRGSTKSTDPNPDRSRNERLHQQETIATTSRQVGPGSRQRVNRRNGEKKGSEGRVADKSITGKQDPVTLSTPKDLESFPRDGSSLPSRSSAGGGSIFATTRVSSGVLRLRNIDMDPLIGLQDGRNSPRDTGQHVPRMQNRTTVQRRGKRSGRRKTKRGRNTKEKAAVPGLDHPSILNDKSALTMIPPTMQAKLDELVAEMQAEKSQSSDGIGVKISSPSTSASRSQTVDTAGSRISNPFQTLPVADLPSLPRASRQEWQQPSEPNQSLSTETSKDAIDNHFLQSLDTRAAEHQGKPSSDSRPSRDNTRALHFGTARSSNPLLSKVQQTNARAAWGDRTPSAPRSGANAASYETLRKADRISPPDPVNPRQSDTKIWGKSSNTASTLEGSKDDGLIGTLASWRQALRQAFRPSITAVDPEQNTEPAAGLTVERDAAVQQGQATSSISSMPPTEALVTDDNAVNNTTGLGVSSPISKMPDRHPALKHESHEQSLESAEQHDPGSENEVTSSELVDQHHDPHQRIADLFADRPTTRAGVSSLVGELDPASKINALDRKAASNTKKRDATLTRVIPKTRQRTSVAKSAPVDRPTARKDGAGQGMATLGESIASDQSHEEQQVSDLEDEFEAMGDDVELGGTGLEAVDASDIRQINANELHISPLDVEQPPVPKLAYGLDRVLFQQGVCQLQDPHSRVYNFDPYLQKIMPVVEFDFNALKEYKTSSQDSMLSDLAKEHGKKYIGSTSSMTSTLAHFHFLLSNFRELNFNMMSKVFPDNAPTFTRINRAPNAMFLRWKNGSYAIDADKEFDYGNVLMMLGKSMELLLTQSRSDYERYRKSDPREVSREEREGPEAYQYTTLGDFLMRSQLDAQDPRLPGTGTFDLKTRAVVSIRMDAEDYVPMTGYEIHTLQGRWNSYEREYYDMVRSTMLKYSLQARMGRMDGIFLAYHNVLRIFGFQYIPIVEMDRALHGQADRSLGDQEFKISIDLYNKVLDMATAKFPDTSLRVFFETRESVGDRPAIMTIFAQPMEEDEIDRIQSLGKQRIAEFEKNIMGKEEEAKQASGSTEVGTAEGDLATLIYNHSGTAADPLFIKRIEKPPDTTLGPLFCATILLHNYTKLRKDPESAWQHCEGNRPTNFTPEHEWRVEYILKEPSEDMSMNTRWSMYEDMKHRRKAAFAKDDEGKDTAVRGPEKKNGGDGYRTFLKSLSQKDAAVRAKLDKIEHGTEKVVVGIPGSNQETSQEGFLGYDVHAVTQSPLESAGIDVESVDDYMRLLYGRP